MRYAGYFRSGVPKSKQKHPPRLESSRSCRYIERRKESALGVFVADSATELVCGATRFGDSVGRPPAAEYVRTRLLACRLLLAPFSLSLLASSVPVRFCQFADTWIARPVYTQLRLTATQRPRPLKESAAARHVSALRGACARRLLKKARFPYLE